MVIVNNLEQKEQFLTYSDQKINNLLGIPEISLRSIKLNCKSVKVIG
jgi:hypothetical protein